MKKILTIPALFISVVSFSLLILQGCTTQGGGQVDAETNEEIKNIDTIVDSVKEDTYSENTLSDL